MAAAALAAGLAFPALVACSDDGDGKAIEEPERTRASSTTTSSTEPPNYSQVSLVPVAPGQAPPITRPREPGKASMSGRVVDETGAPVPGAVVRASYYLDPNKPEVLESLTLRGRDLRLHRPPRRVVADPGLAGTRAGHAGSPVDLPVRR